jgi:hypothetical protein
MRPPGEDERNRDAGRLEPLPRPGEPGGVLDLDGGGRFDPSEPPPRRGVPVWLRGGVLVAGGAILAVLATHAGGPAPVTDSHRTPRAAATSTGSAAPATPVQTAPRVSTGRPLLGATSAWQLVVRGPDEVVRIEVATGRITRTHVPPLASSGTVTLVTAAGWTVIRPLDQVAGYLVRDGQAATTLAGGLAKGGTAFPGPDGAGVWLQQEGAGTFTLYRPDGKAERTLRLAAGFGSLLPDQRGWMLYSGTGGVYQVEADGLERLSSGSLRAVGPTRLLVVECDSRHACVDVLLDRASGARRELGPGTEPTMGPGSISPDGAVAAYAVMAKGGTPQLHLVDLRSGVDTALDEPFPAFGDNTLSWSPDSRWIFLVDDSERLHVIDAATGADQALGVDLPPVDQVAVRPAPPRHP